MKNKEGVSDNDVNEMIVGKNANKKNMMLKSGQIDWFKTRT